MVAVAVAVVVVVVIVVVVVSIVCSMRAVHCVGCCCSCCCCCCRCSLFNNRNFLKQLGITVISPLIFRTVLSTTTQTGNQQSFILPLLIPTAAATTAATSAPTMTAMTTTALTTTAIHAKQTSCQTRNHHTATSLAFHQQQPVHSNLWSCL